MSRLFLSEIPLRWRVIAAFAAVYVLWGSTYLAIRFAVETIPPFLMAGTRFTLAGILLYTLSRWSGAAAPSRRHWRSAVVTGAFLLVGNNGLLTLAEQTVPSGVAALFIATVPLWMILLDWAFVSHSRPTTGVFGGLALGLTGIALLSAPSLQGAAGATDPAGVVMLLLGSLSWAVGSLYARSSEPPPSPLLGVGMQMLAGGAIQLVISALRGEMGQVQWAQFSAQSLVSVAYLTVFGAIVGYTCYVWLLKVSTPTHVSTYAFVNPVVAVFLGWALAGEPLTGRTLVAAFIIVSGVVLITRYQASGKQGTRAQS